MCTCSLRIEKDMSHAQFKPCRQNRKFKNGAHVYSILDLLFSVHNSFNHFTASNLYSYHENSPQNVVCDIPQQY